LHQEIIVCLSDEEKGYARRFAAKAKIPLAEEKAKRSVKVVGVNTGSGRRWPMKQWPVEQCAALISTMLRELGGVKVLLFGGRDEEERNRRIKERVGRGLVDTGCRNTLRQFIALLDLCDCVVSSDTLGLHAALGLGKKAVGLFGPTSAAEIDMYGRGAKLVSDLQCSCCYKRNCNSDTSCMAVISPDSVFQAVRGLL
jgi:heptosyltransferase-2